MALPTRHDFQANDDIGRPRLDWPEPLVLETIRDAYSPAASEDAADAARLHARFLRALLDDEAERSSRLRIELVGCCAARRIAPEAIATADLAAFRELSAVILSRFRNSPRLRVHHLQQLHDALGRLTDRPKPKKKAEAAWRLRLPSTPRPPKKTFAFAG